MVIHAGYRIHAIPARVVYFKKIDSLFRPVGAATVLSLCFMALSIGTMEMMEHVWFERYAYNQLFLMYGKLRGICNVGPFRQFHA